MPNTPRATVNQDVTLKTTTSTNKLVFITAPSPFALLKACPSGARLVPRIFPNISSLWLEFETSSTVCGVLSFQTVRGDEKDALALREKARLGKQLQVQVFHEANIWLPIFDVSFSNWTRQLVSSEIEDWIDESCLLQRRIAYKRRSNCDVLEIAALRAAWFLRKFREHQTLLFPLESETSKALVFERPKAMQRMQNLLHIALYDQLASIFPDITPLPNAIPKTRARTQIDAGYCEIVSAHTDIDSAMAKARCLPSYLIIGAQKSGTDELSVYLNRNSLYNRRMDGGMEVHFFDCVGRGLGNIADVENSFRTSCERARTAMMNAVNPFSTRGGEQRFYWRDVAQQSPYVDELWTHYHRLGQLTIRQYVREHRTLTFEKSPSYFDLADPRDVARLLPRGKFVFLSRDPVPRLLSAYFQYCEAYEVERTAQHCSIQEFDQLARDLVNGKLDVTTRDESLPRRLAFYRGVQYGMYDKFFANWLKYFWTDQTMEEKQFLMVDSSHFKSHPRAVLYAVESFVGIRGPRHFDYKPRMRDGHYTYGTASKASHPTHNSTLSMETEAILREYYRPSVTAFRAMLQASDCPIVFGLMYDEFPADLRAFRADIFQNSSRFAMPNWLKGEASSAEERNQNRDGDF